MRRIAVVAGVPVAAMLVALAIGAVLIARDGENPFAVYADVVRGVFVAKRGLRSTAIGGDPADLHGPRAWPSPTGPSCSRSAPRGSSSSARSPRSPSPPPSGVRDLPGFVLRRAGVIVVAGVVGAAVERISAVLANRFNTSIVISSLLLTYVAAAVMQWMIRIGIKDPKSFVPASRVIGDAGPADRAGPARPPRLRASPSRSCRSPGW